MKPKRYLVFGFKTVARLDGKGGWDDLLDSFNTPDQAIERGNKFLSDNADLDNKPKFQVIDIRIGLTVEVTSGERQEVDAVHALEILRPNVMDGENPWELH